MPPASDGERERGSWWQGGLPWPLSCALAQEATLRRALALGVMLCSRCLEILNNFFNKGGVPLLHFILGPAKCLASPVVK